MKQPRLLTVMRKELVDGFRDRRAIYTILLGAIVGPLVVGLMFTRMTGQEKAAQDIQVPVVGREHAPLLVNWLQQQRGVQITNGPDDPETAVRSNLTDVVLVIEKDFAEKFRDSRPAPVKVVSDSTRNSARSKVRRLNSLLGRFSTETGSLRLMARGINPVVSSALNVKQVEVSSAQQRVAVIFGFIPMFLLVSTFSAGMQIATDSTAGERERGSLEPLLLNPIPRWQLLTGKWLAASVAAFGGMVGTLLVTAFVMSRLSLEDMGIRFQLGGAQMLWMIAAMWPLAMLAPSMQMYLACYARSFKEAQGYMAFLVLGATAPALVTTFYPASSMPWMRWIPLLGQYVMGSEILSGRAPHPLLLLTSALLCGATAVLFLKLATRMFSSERIIFSR